jgi:Competence protein CoiA-like family
VAFRAVHAEWGTVFSHLPGLGCGQAWETVWKVRPPAPLTCDECHHRMFAKVSRNGLRFFAHAPHAPNCALALETLAHHMLKLELANAARDAGAHAEMEVRAPDGAWRADVLASDQGGTWRIALEAQLAAITDDDIKDRTGRMQAGGVRSIWFSDKPCPPWLGVVPSVRLAQSDDGEGLVVAEGLVKFHPCSEGTYIDRFLRSGWEPIPATLVEFLRWAFAGAIRPHKRRFHDAMVWSARRYIAEEIAAADRYERLYAAAQERWRRSPERKEEKEKRRRESLRRQVDIARKNAASRATALWRQTRPSRRLTALPRVPGGASGVQRARGSRGPLRCLPASTT